MLPPGNCRLPHHRSMNNKFGACSQLRSFSMLFKYSPLEKGQFCLLSIIDVEDNINCKLEDFALDRAPEYDANSYAWVPNMAMSRSLAMATTGPSRLLNPVF